MNVRAGDNLLEVWNRLCSLIEQKGSVVQHDQGAKLNEVVKFNQIKLNLASKLWQSLLPVLEPLSEEEIEVLLELSKTNNTHNIYQSKVSLIIFISIPIGVLYTFNLVVQNFDLNKSDFLSPPVIWGIIAGFGTLLLLGIYMLYKQLSYRWLSMELTTCLETMLAIKKSERIQFRKQLLIPIQLKEKK